MKQREIVRKRRRHAKTNCRRKTNREKEELIIVIYCLQCKTKTPSDNPNEVKETEILSL